MNNLRNMVFIALLIAMALAVSLIENMIPLPFIVPGFKLGLSNMVILVTMNIFDFKRGFSVAVLKSVLLMLIVGFGPSFLYSFVGAVFSAIMMGISMKFFNNIFSILGISIIGAVCHNFAQVSVASFILGSIMLFSYLPVLTIVGIVTGYFVGLGSFNVSVHLKKLNIVT